MTLPLPLRVAALLAVVVLALWCYAPALNGYFVTDDFGLLALSRLQHRPWLVFVHDHFPGSLYFRPLGMFVWWLVSALSDTAPRAQYAVSLALHVLVAGALYSLLQRIRRNAPLNAAWTAVYAIHPLTIGTALWLSDRFDLLATLFALLTLNAALAYAQRPRPAVLWTMLLTLLLSLLSKELGVVAAAAAFVAIAFAPRRNASYFERAAALIGIAALTVLWLGYRHAMLTRSGIPGADALPSPMRLLVGGWNWLRLGGEFLSLDPRLPLWASVCLGLAAALWLVAALLRGRSAAALPWNLHLALATIVLLPALAQAPVTVNINGLDVGTGAFDLIVWSRFFYLSFAGLIALLMVLTTPAADVSPSSSAPTRIGRFQALFAIVGVMLAVLALAPASQRIADNFARESHQPEATLEALESALATIELPAHACQVYLLETSSIGGLAGYIDAVVKSLSGDPGRIAHCLFSTERLPWTFFLRAGSVSASDYQPLRPLTILGHAVPSIVIGDIELKYFSIGDGMASAIPSSAIFLAYRDGRFIDVSGEVRSGERTLNFVTSP